jgi:hypothetical protein
MILENTSTGTAASTDFIVSSNSGTSSTYYGDFGINGSGFVGTGSLGLPNATYLYSQNGDLAIGTASSNAIHFVVNSGTTDAATINTSGTMILNNGLTMTGGLLDIISSRETVTDIVQYGSTITYALTTNSSTIFYHAVAQTSNWTVALTNIPTDNGKILSVSIMVPQTSTAYSITGLTINGVAATVYWIGSTGFPTGTASKTDMWTFSLIRRGNSWTVLGILSGNFG